MLTTQTTKRTISLEKHLVAAEFASGVLDRLLAMGFEECRQTIAREAGSRNVLDDPSMKCLGNGGEAGATRNTPLGASPGEGATFQDGLLKSFQDFTYEVTMTEPGKKEDLGQMFTIAVEVRWPPAPKPAAPNSRTLRNYLLQAVKFNENP
jgi:hypothetical protein